MQLKIENPCPAKLTSLKACGSNFYCKGCNKIVYDVREKSQLEINDLIKEKNFPCIISNSTQLLAQYTVHHSVFYKFRYFVLTVFAFFGFNFGPIKASNPVSIQDSTKNKSVTKIKIAKKDSLKSKSKELPPNEAQKKKQRRKKKNESIIGCPSF